MIAPNIDMKIIGKVPLSIMSSSKGALAAFAFPEAKSPIKTADTKNNIFLFIIISSHNILANLYFPFYQLKCHPFR